MKCVELRNRVQPKPYGKLVSLAKADQEIIPTKGNQAVMESKTLNIRSLIE